MKTITKLPQLLLSLVFVNSLVKILAVPLKNTRDINNSTITANDLTTDFAREIIKIAKAADIKAYMDDNIDPCNDFYKFSCGNWHRINPAQLLSSIVTDTFRTMEKAFDRKLNKLLHNQQTDNDIENKVKDFYTACRAVKTGADSYKAQLQSVYKEFGNMPAIMGDAWNETDFEWWRTIAQIQHKYGKDIILGVTIMGDIEQNTKNNIYIGPPENAGGANSKVLDVLQLAKTTEDLELELGLELELAQRTAKEMVEFERQLVQGGTSSFLALSLKDMISNRTVIELQNEIDASTNGTGAMNVKHYLEIVLGGYTPDQIYVYDSKYWRNVLAVLEQKPKRIVANYIMWQLMQEFRIKVDSEHTADNIPWCIRRTKKYFGKFIDNLIYSKYKNNAIEQDVYQVWGEVQQTFREQLQGNKLDWIKNETREYAIEKLNAMKLEINSYETENFTQLYAGLEHLNKQSYIENMKVVLAQRAAQHLAKMNHSVISLEDTEVFSFTPAYNILENNIKIPVALLQPLYLWDANYPKAIKYATLGYLIAHELIHGFDDDGRKHDKQGNFQEWWDPKSTYEFESRRKCFQAQYHNYKYGGRRLPESISQSENIADNAGVKLAYAAYMKWWNSQEDDDVLAKENLPNLNYNNRQLFFIAFAQVWCDDIQSLFKSSVAVGNAHAPSMYRVIGSLSNFQEFSWVFKCKQDAPMDPEFKCAIY